METSDRFSCQMVLGITRKKAELHVCDLDDVTLGSPAIFCKSEQNYYQIQQELLKTRGFPAPPHDGFGFSDFQG